MLLLHQPPSRSPVLPPAGLRAPQPPARPGAVKAPGGDVGGSASRSSGNVSAQPAASLFRLPYQQRGQNRRIYPNSMFVFLTFESFARKLAPCESRQTVARAKGRTACDAGRADAAGCDVRGGG